MTVQFLFFTRYWERMFQSFASCWLLYTQPDERTFQWWKIYSWKFFAWTQYWNMIMSEKAALLQMLWERSCQQLETAEQLGGSGTVCKNFPVFTSKFSMLLSPNRWIKSSVIQASFFTCTLQILKNSSNIRWICSVSIWSNTFYTAVYNQSPWTEQWVWLAS